MSIATELLANQERESRRQIEEILHKQKKLVTKGRKIDVFNDPVTQRVQALAQEGFATTAICDALNISAAMVQLRLNRSKMVHTAGLGMSRRDFRNGTSIIAQRKIQAIIRKPVRDAALIRHLDKYAQERAVKLNKRPI